MNRPHHLTPGSDDELNWLAFRYVAGEMTAEETESFEARLTDDLAACEAVVAMSELSLSAQVAIVTEIQEAAIRVEDPRPVPARIRSWVAVGSTVVALGWLMLLLGNGNDQMKRGSPELAERGELQSAADLIARWSQADEEAVLSDEFLEATSIEFSGADELERPYIPGWMIAAVSLENTEPPSDEMPEVPPNGTSVEVKEN